MILDLSIQRRADLIAFILLLLVGLVLQPGHGKASSVAIEAAGRSGQGLLFHHGGVCYALTAGHVMGAPGMPMTIVLPQPSRLQGQGIGLVAIPGDLGLMEVLYVPRESCGRPFSTLKQATVDFYKSERRPRRAILPQVQPSGSFDTFALEVDRYGPFHLQVRIPEVLGADIRQGMSGSAVSEGDHPIAMLLDSSTDSRDGRAIRLDIGLWLVARYLTPVHVAPTRPVAEVKDTGSPPFAIHTVSFDGTTRGGSPSVLMEPEGAWISRPNSFPIEITLKADADRIEPISSVAILAPESAPPDQLPRRISVFYSTSGSGETWSPVSPAVFPQAARQVEVGLRKRVRRLKIVIHDTWGAPEVQVSQIRVR